ncbi:MAG: nucleotide exchange factor GrpE [Firmicutes bacterium]|nr:nucleotide exchange factor GrpE [Bacillota bacterium]
MKKRRRRRKNVFNPEEHLPKQVVSMSDLQSGDEADDSEDILDVEGEDAGDEGASSIQAISSSGLSDGTAESVLASFSIEDDLLKLNEEVEIDLSLSSHLQSGDFGISPKPQTSREENRQAADRDLLKLDELMDFKHGLDAVASIAELGEPEEELFAGKLEKDDFLSIDKHSSKLEIEYDIEEKPSAESVLDMFAMPKGDLSDMFKEEMIQDDVFSRLSIEEPEDVEPETEAIPEPEVIEEKTVPAVEEKVEEPAPVEEQPAAVEEPAQEIPEALPVVEETPVEEPMPEPVAEVKESAEEPAAPAVRKQAVGEAGEDIVNDSFVVYRKKRKTDDIIREIEKTKAEKTGHPASHETEPEKEEVVQPVPVVEVVEEVKAEVVEEPAAGVITAEPETLPAPVAVQAEAEEVKPAAVAAPVVAEAVPAPVLPQTSEATSQIDDEIANIRNAMSTILSRVEYLENVKKQIETGGTQAPVPVPEAAPAPAAPEALPAPAVKAAPVPPVVEQTEEPFIPTLEVPEIEHKPEIKAAAEVSEPVPAKVEVAEISVKEQRIIRKEVDDLLEGISKVTIEKEIGFFGSLIRTVPALFFLKPRFAEIVSREEADYKTLVGLYRIAARFLQDELVKREKEIDQLRKEFQKYKKESSSSKLEYALKPSGKPQPIVKTEPALTEGEMFVLKEEIRKKDKRLVDLDTMIDRMKLDFVNLKNRQQKEVDIQVLRQTESMVLQMLTVVDNLERAIAFASGNDYNKAVIDGFVMTLDGMLGILKKLGLEDIPARDRKFDPNFHESLLFEETAQYPDGYVMEELRKGYMFGTKVLRPVQVKVSRLPAGAVAPPPPMPKTEKAAPAPAKTEAAGPNPLPASEKIKEAEKEEVSASTEKGSEGYTLEAFFGGNLDKLNQDWSSGPPME